MERIEDISGNLAKLRDSILGYARGHGLDPFDVRYIVSDYDTINILAAQGGFPSRYPHWRFGMEYDQLSKGHTYGMQKIYEMVINTDPCYAYLLRSNNIVDQKIVMAHVYGHADFFKNNAWFKNTNRKMLDVMANHGSKIRRYMDKIGQDKVELFIDQVLSLENLLDIQVLFETSEMVRNRTEINSIAEKEELECADDDRSNALKSFMRSVKREQNKKNVDHPVEEERPEDSILKKSKMVLPERDIMKFLADFAPIDEWQSDIISILREEAYYFLPQRMTKIMNEGWASYWHSKIMTQNALDPSEIIDFADAHAGVMQMGRRQLNPYKIGIELFRDIEFRWNRGRYGKNYQECESMREKENWNLELNKGIEKIFDVRKTHNDITFIDEFLTPEFCDRNQIFTYKYNPRTGRYEIDSREFAELKAKLLTQLTNFGRPVIDVVDANYKNRGELALAHDHNGTDLDMGHAADTLKNIYAIWKRPVNLITKYNEKNVTFVYDGQEMRPQKV